MDLAIGRNRMQMAVARPFTSDGVHRAVCSDDGRRPDARALKQVPMLANLGGHRQWNVIRVAGIAGCPS